MGLNHDRPVPSHAYSIDPIRLTRSTSQMSPASEGDSNGEVPSGRNENTAMLSWLHGHTQKIGNTSEIDLQSIINSIKFFPRAESDKFPRLKVYNYNFPDSGDSREILVYSIPDEEKQFIVNIDDLDLRQNLIVFKLGDLGFGFAKDNTYVVLRKSMSSETFHYLNLAYIQPTKKTGTGTWDVEWDIVKPRDLLPIPLILKEPEEAHEEHCDSRKCGIKEFIFGTCPIVRLTCEDLKKLPLEGHEKERVEALLREKEPFLYELARSLSVNKQYLEKEGDDTTAGESISYRAKRSPNHRTDGSDSVSSRNTRAGEADMIGHHSVKKDHALVGAASSQLKAVNGVEASMQHFQRQLNGDKPPKLRLRAPGMENVQEPQDSVASAVSEVEQSDNPIGAVGTFQSMNLEEGVAESENARFERSYDKEEQTSREKFVRNPTRTKRNHSAPSSAFDRLLIQKSPVTAANLTLRQVPIQAPLKLPNEEKSYFENVLDKIRNSPPSKYTVRPYECITCEPIGTFMAEYSENPLVSYVVNNLVGDIFRDVLGKRKLFSPEANEILQEHAKIPFIGYGSCEYAVEALGKKPKSLEVDDIIEFYSETLAVNCEKKDCEAQRPRVRMREILTSKHHLLTIWPDLSVRVNRTSNLPRNLLLSTNEFRQFMISLIFSAYTTEYRMQIMDHVDSSQMEGLPNQNVSPRMKFLTRLLMKVVDELIKNFSQHIIKGIRYLLQILQEKYLTLIAEQLAIIEFNFNGNEKERQIYMQQNKDDRLQVLAIKDFLINGIAPIIRSRSDPFPAFSTFFSRNYRRIVNMVIEQGISHEHKEKKSGGKAVRSAEVDQFWESLNGGGERANGYGIAGEKGNVEPKHGE